MQPDTEKEFAIKRETDIVDARQSARELALHMGFKLVACTWIATVVSELARNIMIYTSGGIIHLSSLTDNGRQGVEIIARDVGPGIEDVNMVMSDGYSTRNGLGMGLPGSKRLMDDFQIESQLGKGTTITARKWLN